MPDHHRVLPDSAVIWRGPKKNGLIKQLLRDVDWGSLDYLIVDTPPGTSDEHLSIVQVQSFVLGCLVWSLETSGLGLRQVPNRGSPVPGGGSPEGCRGGDHAPGDRPAGRQEGNHLLPQGSGLEHVAVIDDHLQVGLPLLGLVENMSQFVCPSCHKVSVG